MIKNLIAMMTLLATLLSSAEDTGRGIKPFIDETKAIPAVKMWERELIISEAGEMPFEITGEGPFTVMLMTDELRTHLSNGGQVTKENISGILLSHDEPGDVFAWTAKMPAKKVWLMLQNRGSENGKFRVVGYGKQQE